MVLIFLLLEVLAGGVGDEMARRSSTGPFILLHPEMSAGTKNFGKDRSRSHRFLGHLIKY